MYSFQTSKYAGKISRLTCLPPFRKFQIHIEQWIIIISVAYFNHEETQENELFCVITELERT